MLSRMSYPEFPVPVGVFRRVERPTHDQLIQAQIDEQIAAKGAGELGKLLKGGDAWVVAS